MKTLSLIAVAVAALAGCATAPTLANPDLDPSATEFTGWVRVSHGEFQLFQEQRDLRGMPSALRCVSGALPRDLQDTARDLSGSKVVFTGRAVAWNGRDGAQTMLHQGARISNQCRADHVIKADAVRVLR
ncbi:hypothetical protein [Brevundimonas sp.]|jgi:hypothetical protein|uniref:hypothetical protein n=1 Tax=Brevundimonas sp. TaxID=1871086 RepID=UPI0037BECE1F